MQSLIDTHAHINDRQFRNDEEGAVARASAEGVDLIICPGYDLPSSRRAVELAQQFDGIWAAVGVHPHDAKLLDDAALAELKRLAAEPKVVAIGEIGLDFYRDLSPRPVQEEAFRLQLRLAKDLGLPIIVHDRDAQEDVLKVIEDEGPPPAGGVMHCFSGDLEQARRAFGMGFYIGVAGPVTYGKSNRLREVVKTVRAERLLIETDSPYLTPEPFRGRRKNEPALVRLVAEKLAEIRRMSLDDVARITTENALRLFRGIKR